jgi:phytoene dehydrogenase-like protein
VTSRHYDVIVLGRSIGALTAAAVLARREFRVLLLGQREPPPSYHFEGRRFRRRAFTFLAGTSPVWSRVLHELAQTQTFRRRQRQLDPMFVVVADDYRLDVPPDGALFAREIEREFPEVRQVVDELYGKFAEVNAAADATLERDITWPPGTLWERFDANRATASLPLKDAADSDALLGKFPPGHPYREVTLLPARFASHLATPTGQLPPLAVARLHGAWTRGVLGITGGADELESFLIDRINAHGGVCRLDGSAESLVIRRGALVGVIEQGEDEMTGADLLVTSEVGESLAELSGGRGISKAARREWPRVTATVGRFVVSLVVRTAGLPDPLAQEAFLLPPRGTHPSPRRPAVHLQRFDTPAEEGASPETLLVAETLLSSRGTLTPLEARDAVLDTLRHHLPFLDRHLVAVDSPHDGRALWDYSSGGRRDIDRIHVTESSPEPEPMQWLWTVEPTGYLGVAGEPVRGPIPSTYLVGPTVLPALGQEGELLAALSAARIITRRDRTRQKMRRDMWTKLEMG